jgi:hypothetical protein
MRGYNKLDVARCVVGLNQTAWRLAGLWEGKLGWYGRMCSPLWDGGDGHVVAQLQRVLGVELESAEPSGRGGRANIPFVRSRTCLQGGTWRIAWLPRCVVPGDRHDPVWTWTMVGLVKWPAPQYKPCHEGIVL